MSIKLIYHTKESVSGGVSPFDKAISEITKGKDMLIACPYVGLTYFKRIINQSKSFRLLTDVEEWVLSQPKHSRGEIQDFISTYSDRIHHYKNLHAKVIIAGDKALIGSVNLTQKGITERVEMCALLEDSFQVKELKKWFQTLWLESASVDEAELKQFISSPIPEPNYQKKTDGLTSIAPIIKSKLLDKKNIPLKGDISNPSSHDRLVERVALVPDAQLLDKYFDLVREVIITANIREEDPRLSLTIPKNILKLPVNINQRYVLNFGFGYHSVTEFFIVTGFIINKEYHTNRLLKGKVLWNEPFKPHRGERLESVPYWVGFDGIPNLIFTNSFKEKWMEAVFVELERGRRSGFRKFHEPAFYDAAVDKSYRALVMKEAFAE